jgi:hypothetical protein
LEIFKKLIIASEGMEQVVLVGSFPKHGSWSGNVVVRENPAKTFAWDIFGAGLKLADGDCEALKANALPME